MIRKYLMILMLLGGLSGLGCVYDVDKQMPVQVQRGGKYVKDNIKLIKTDIQDNNVTDKTIEKLALSETACDSITGLGVALENVLGTPKNDPGEFNVENVENTISRSTTLHTIENKVKGLALSSIQAIAGLGGFLGIAGGIALKLLRAKKKVEDNLDRAYESFDVVKSNLPDSIKENIDNFITNNLGKIDASRFLADKKNWDNTPY